MEFKLTATKNLELGDTGDGVVGTMVITTESSDWAGKTITLKARARGNSDGAWNNVAYQRRDTEAVVAGGTAINANGVWEVNAAGLEIRAEYVHAGAAVTTLTADPLAG